MAKSKSKQKKGKQANLSKARKKGSTKKKTTSKTRKDGKKKTSRKKPAPRPNARRVKTTPANIGFTEIASEEVTSPTPAPAQGEQEMLGSTESTWADKNESTPTNDNSNIRSI